MSKASILIVEDDTTTAKLLGQQLVGLGYSVVGSATNGADALAMAAQHQPAMVLMDILLDGPIDGIETAKRLAEVVDVPVIFLSVSADRATLLRLKGVMPYGYLRKPFESDELEATIDVALKRHQADALHLIYQRAITTSSAGLVVCDARQPDCPIVEINPRFSEMTGYTSSEVVGRNCRFLQGPETDQNARAILRDAVRTETETRVTILNYRKDGTTFWNDITVYPVRNTADQLTHFVGQQIDVTDRMRAEEALRDSQRRLLEAQRISRLGNWERILPDHRLILSDEVYRIMGRQRGEFANTYAAFMEIVHPEDRPAVLRARDQSESAGKYELEYRIMRPGGELRYVLVNGEISCDATGKAERVFGTVQDITEQRRVLDSLRQSEERLAEAQRIAHLGNWDLDLVTGAVWRSEEVFRIYERSLAEMPNDYEGFISVVHPDDRELVGGTFRNRIETLQPSTLDYRIILPSGKVRIIMEHGRVVADAQGKAVRMFGIVQDVTKQRLALAALRDSADRFRATFEQAAVGVAHVSLDGLWLRVNARLCEIVGYSREELTQRNFRDVTHPDDIATDLELLGQLRSGQTRHYNREKRYLRKGGGVVWINLTVSLVRDRLGQPQYFIAVVEDIMRRKATEAALQEKEAHLRAIIANEPECVQQMDRRGLILEINPAGLAMLEADSPGQLVNHDAAELVVEKYLPAWRELLAAALSGEPHKLEFEVTSLRGNRRWLEIHCAPLREFGGGGEVRTILAIMRDITQRKQAEIAFETLLRSTAAAVGVDFFPTIVRELSALLGLRHVYVAEIIPEDPGRVRTLAFCRDGVLVENFEYELAGSPCHDAMQSGTLTISEKVGAMYPRSQLLSTLKAESYLGLPLYSNRREVIGFFTVLGDKPAAFDPLSRSLISVFAVRVEAELQRLLAEEDRRRIEAQFFQAQKMEALGTLAGGVAHDFNNILTGILNYAELAKISSPENAEAVGYIDEVTNAGRRARDLVAQILAFSRSELRAPQPMHLDPVVREALRLLRSTLPANIEIEQRLAADAPVVLADPSQMHQVVMNLCVNASQAIRDGTGRIEVALEAFKVDRKFAHQHPGFPPGIALKLTVKDTGPGMDQRTLARIFEPFFTTKAPGEGTGLGLPVVHGIVKNHRGVIEVFSAVGEGVTVQVYLPAYDEAFERASSEAGNGEGAVVPPGASERILLVDDEVGVADSTRLMLENLGYRVTMHCDSEQAFEVFAQEPRAYDLILTDYLMPRMNGVVLAEKILSLRPEIPILMTSGFVSNWSPEKLREHGIRDLVPKPTSVVDLAWIISRTLRPVKQD